MALFIPIDGGMPPAPPLCCAPPCPARLNPPRSLLECLRPPVIRLEVALAALAVHRLRVHRELQNRVGHGIRVHFERGQADVVVRVAGLVVAGIENSHTGRAAVDRRLLRGLDLFGAGEQTRRTECRS